MRERLVLLYCGSDKKQVADNACGELPKAYNVLPAGRQPPACNHSDFKHPSMGFFSFLKHTQISNGRISRFSNRAAPQATYTDGATPLLMCPHRTVMHANGRGGGLNRRIASLLQASYGSCPPPATADSALPAPSTTTTLPSSTLPPYTSLRLQK